MPFKRILKDLTTRTQAEGAIMLDWEGEAVDMFANTEEMELDAIGAHKGIILNLLKEAVAKDPSSGEVESVGISTDGYRIAISVVKDGYYILVAMKKTRPFGKAFFESRKAVKELMVEMG